MYGRAKGHEHNMIKLPQQLLMLVLCAFLVFGTASCASNPDAGNKTTMSDPPTKDVADVAFGTMATLYLSAKPGPPVFSSVPISDGPPMSIGTDPSTKFDSDAPLGGFLSAMPSAKKLL